MSERKTLQRKYLYYTTIYLNNWAIIVKQSGIICCSSNKQDNYHNLAICFLPKNKFRKSFWNFTTFYRLGKNFNLVSKFCFRFMPTFNILMPLLHHKILFSSKVVLNHISFAKVVSISLIHHGMSVKVLFLTQNFHTFRLIDGMPWLIVWKTSFSSEGLNPKFIGFSGLSKKLIFFFIGK